MLKKFRMFALVVASAILVMALAACGSKEEEETTTAAPETTTAVEETEEEEVVYTQQKVATVTLPFGDVELTCQANEDISKIRITFSAFDEDQELRGSIKNGKFISGYDKTGFFGGDAMAMWDGIQADPGEWTPIE